MTEDTEKAVTENVENTRSSMTLFVHQESFIKTLQNIEPQKSEMVAITFVAGKPDEDENLMDYHFAAYANMTFADTYSVGNADDEMFGKRAIPNMSADGLEWDEKRGSWGWSNWPLIREMRNEKLLPLRLVCVPEDVIPKKVNRLAGIRGPNAVIELPDEYDASTRLGKALAEAVEIFEKAKAKRAAAKKAEEEADAA